MVEVDNLVFEYPAGRVLHGVDFRLAPGSITALVGPNGAGKTTLMRCLAGLEAWNGGRIRIDGVDLATDPRAAHRRIGFLPDHFGVYSGLSAFESLAYTGEIQGLSRAGAEGRAREVARLVGLEEQLPRRATDLSRGQRQRLALAQAIVHRPRVLIADEPASGLDPEARAGLSRLLRRLAAEGMTLLVSSHILAELAEYSTAMLVLERGRLLEHRRLDGAELGTEIGAETGDGIATGAGGLAETSLVAELAGAAEAQAWATRWGGTAEGHRVRLALPLAPGQDARAARAAWLARAIAEGAPVAGLAAATESLQDSYLAVVGRHRALGPGGGGLPPGDPPLPPGPGRDAGSPP